MRDSVQTETRYPIERRPRPAYLQLVSTQGHGSANTAIAIRHQPEPEALASKTNLLLQEANGASEGSIWVELLRNLYAFDTITSKTSLFQFQTPITSPASENKEQSQAWAEFARCRANADISIGVGEPANLRAIIENEASSNFDAIIALSDRNLLQPEIYSDFLEFLGRMESQVSLEKRKHLLRKEIRNHDPQIRYGAISGLVGAGDKESKPLLESVARNERSPLILRALRIALKNLD